MALSKAVFTWTGKTVDGKPGGEAKTVVTGCTAEVKAANLLTTLISMSDCGAAARSYASRVVLGNEPVTGGSTDKRGVAYLQDVDSGRTIRLSIPGVKVSMTEEVPGKDGGWRLTAACMETLKVAMQNATGLTLRKLYGVVYTKV